MQPGAIAEHEAILGAIKEQNVVLARALLALHHDSIAVSLRAEIEQQAAQAEN
jgi:DNA-binding GntR family transcriptional regulator